MSKTADPLGHPRTAGFPAVLLIVTICLVTHFLVEDVFLLRVMETSSLRLSTLTLAPGEVDHQDDLAVVVALPGHIPHSDSPIALSMSMSLGRYFAVPIRIPPKIA